MPKYEINAPYPGSYVEGLGILEPGTVIDLPEKLTLHDGEGGTKEVVIEPRCMWIPLDEAAKQLFARYRRTPNPRLEIRKKKGGGDPSTVKPFRPPWADKETPAGFEESGEKVKMIAPPKRASDS